MLSQEFCGFDSKELKESEDILDKDIVFAEILQETAIIHGKTDDLIDPQQSVIVSSQSVDSEFSSQHVSTESTDMDEHLFVKKIVDTVVDNVTFGFGETKLICDVPNAGGDEDGIDENKKSLSIRNRVIYCRSCCLQAQKST